MIADFIKRIFSLVSKKPVFKGYGFTTDVKDKIDKDPTIADPNNLIFFKLRTDLSVFEIRKVIKKRDGRVTYVIFNSHDLLEFEISKKWFDYLFEEVANETFINYES